MLKLLQNANLCISNKYYRWADNRMAKKYASNRGMKRRVKFAFSLISAVIQYCIEKKQGKTVPSKSEFVKMYYEQYLELNASHNSQQGRVMFKRLKTNENVTENSLK